MEKLCCIKVVVYIFVGVYWFDVSIGQVVVNMDGVYFSSNFHVTKDKKMFNLRVNIFFGRKHNLYYSADQ